MQTQTPQKIFVLGATGYIGSAVAEAVARAGYHVVAATRSEEAAARLKEKGYDPVRADLRDPGALAELAGRADAVIHAAATGTPDAGAVDAAATRSILQALEGSGKPFVYTSGVWSLGSTGETPVDENVAANPIAHVAWRDPVEREVLAAAARGVRSVLIRPTIVYGRGGGIPGMLAAEARDSGVVRVVGDGRQEWTTVHVDDLADLYVRALAAPPGSLLHGAHGPAYAVRDLALAASLGQGKGGRVEEWPLEEARRDLGDVADGLALHQRVSARRTRALTGWAPTAPTILEDLVAGSYAERA